MQKDDRYTLSGNEKGNGALTYPVGLLTADEATLAGNGYYGYSKSTYLCTGGYFWLLSPMLSTASTNTSSIGVFAISSIGNLHSQRPGGSLGVRPSVSLRPGTTFTSGDGSMESPYIVE